MRMVGKAGTAGVNAGHEGVELCHELGGGVVGGVEVVAVEDELVYICRGLVVRAEGVGDGGVLRGELQDGVYAGVGAAYGLLRVGTELLRCHTGPRGVEAIPQKGVGGLCRLLGGGRGRCQGERAEAVKEAKVCGTQNAAACRCCSAFCCALRPSGCLHAASCNENPQSGFFPFSLGVSVGAVVSLQQDEELLLHGAVCRVGGGCGHVDDSPTSFGEVVELLVEQLGAEGSVEARVSLTDDFIFSARCFFGDGREGNMAVEFAAFLAVEAGAHVKRGAGSGLA